MFWSPIICFDSTIITLIFVAFSENLNFTDQKSREQNYQQEYTWIFEIRLNIVVRLNDESCEQYCLWVWMPWMVKIRWHYFCFYLLLFEDELCVCRFKSWPYLAPSSGQIIICRAYSWRRASAICPANDNLAARQRFYDWLLNLQTLDELWDSRRARRRQPSNASSISVR